jgi:DNA-binding HxlR family transcriptional regulator
MEKRAVKERVGRRQTLIRETNCEYGRAFYLLQERWVLFTIHHLLEGKLGFNELSRREPRVNPTTLSQCLNLLEAAGLVTREVHSTIPPKTSYELTEAGRALKPIMKSVGQWSAKYLSNLPCVLDEESNAKPS